MSKLPDRSPFSPLPKPGSVHVLHLEDNESDALLTKGALEKSGLHIEITVATDATQYESALSSGQFDLILSDHGLPGFSGRAALESAQAKCPRVPFLFVTGADNESEVAAGLKAGASGFFSKAELWRLTYTIRGIADKRALERAFEDTERKNCAMNRLLVAVQELSLARSMETIMAIVRRAARELTGADGATLILRDQDKCFYADEDAIAPLWKGQRFPLSACISGWTMLNRQPAVIEDIYCDPRIPAEAYRPTFVKSLAMVPVRVEDPIAAIGNYWASRHLPTNQEVELLQALANTTAVAIESVELYNQLEQRVQERTRQLQEANRELEAFSYSVSHDLRAPLQHIIGFAALIEEDSSTSLSSSSQDFLTRIVGSTQEMGRLINDLLRLATFSFGQLELTSVNLSTIASQICMSLLAQDPKRKAEFRIAPTANVQGDPGLLRAMMENLFSNAWKYTAKKDRSIIEFDSTTISGERQFFVRDNGVGFNLNYAGKLFAPFQRLHKKEEFPGNGIGLATVRRVIHRHGGRVWAESEPDNGAVFYFTLGTAPA